MGIKAEFVTAGQSFAGGHLTESGAEAVNAHRQAVLSGRKKPVKEEVLTRLYGMKGVLPEEIAKAEKSLSSTPW